MIQRPRLKTFITLYPISEDRWVFRGGTNEVCRVDLRNARARKALTTVVPLLDGHRELPEVLALAREEGVDQDAAMALLAHLERARCLEEAPAAGAGSGDGLRDQETFFSHFTAEGGGQYLRRLSASRVAVAAQTALREVLRRQLTQSGIGEVLVLAETDNPISAMPLDGDGADGRGARLHLDRVSLWPSDSTVAPPDLVVLAQDAHDGEILAAIDSFSKRCSVPWLHVRLLSNNEAWIGPLFVPGETASYASFEARLRGEIPLFEPYPGMNQYLKRQDGPARSNRVLGAQLEVVAGIAVTEVVKLLSGHVVPHLAGRFLALNLMTWQAESFDVWKIPRLDRIAPPRPQPFPWKDALYGQTSTHNRRA